MRKRFVFSAAASVGVAFLATACVQPNPVATQNASPAGADVSVENAAPKTAAAASANAETTAHDPVTVRAIQALFAKARASTASRAAGDALADLSAILKFPDINHSHFNAIFLRGAVHQAAGNKLAAREDLNAIFAFPGNSTAHGPVFFLRNVLQTGESYAAADARLTREVFDSESDVALYLSTLNDTREKSAGKGAFGGGSGSNSHLNNEAALAALKERASRNADAVLARGIIRAQSGRYADCVSDFRAVSSRSTATPAQKAEATFFLATALGVLGDSNGEFAEYSKIHKSPVLPADLQPAATLLRIMASGHSGGIEKTLPKFDALLRDTNLAAVPKLAQCFLRGLASGRVGEMRSAMEDFHLVLTDRAAPPELVALVRRHFHDPPLPVEPPF